MGYDDIVNNLGAIAKSGSKEFIKTLGEEENKTEDVLVPGQSVTGSINLDLVVREDLSLEVTMEMRLEW